MNKKPSILVVDDEPINLKLASVALRDEFELHFAKSGEEALKYLENSFVDLILLDILMEGMSGFEVAQKLQLIEQTSGIPIIYLTGDNSEETIEKAFDSGAVDFLTKPFRNKELLTRVKNRIETQQLKQSLQYSSKKNEHLLDIINNYLPYIKTDTDGIITEVSSTMCTMLQSKEDLVGQNIHILKSGNMPKSFYKELWDTIESGKVFTGEIENHNFLNETNWYKTTITPDVDDNGITTGYIAFYINIDEQVRYEQEAYADFLTGLTNRAKFEAILHEEIYRFKRYHQPFTLIMIDIDYFKEVNDNFGHDAGDIVLVEFANLLSRNIRETDILARWGGEEFIILCSHTDLSGALKLAQSLRKKIEAHPFPTIGNKTASFGVTQYHGGLDQHALFNEVDMALYYSKQNGRNMVSHT